MIDLLLADERSLFREAVRDALRSRAGLRVVAECGSGSDAIAQAERLAPDVAVLDAGLRGPDVSRTITLIKRHASGCAVLVLAEDGDVDLMTSVFEAGANGFLTKRCEVGELIRTVRAVNRGETVVPPTMLGDLLTGLIRRRRIQDGTMRRIAQLTRREREVLALLADGADKAAIARNLVISPATARTHIQNVLGKLGVHSRLEAAMLISNNGVRAELLDPDKAELLDPDKEEDDPTHAHDRIGPREPGSSRSASSAAPSSRRPPDPPVPRPRTGRRRDPGTLEVGRVDR